MDRFVTVAVFTYPHELAVVRARLESEGIVCVAKDEFTVSANPLYSNLVGGIKLQVPAEDADRARAILEEDKSASLDDDEEGAPPELLQKMAAWSPPKASALSARQARLILYGLLAIAVVLLILFI